MKYAIRGFVVAACVVFSLSVNAKETYSGFLEADSYALLKPATSASGEPVMRWVSPKLKNNKNHYHQIMMVPTQFYPELKPSAKLSKETMNDILTYFDGAVGRQLYTVMPTVKNPSPQRLASKALHTLKLRVAITAVATKKTDIDESEMVMRGFTSANLKAKDQPVMLSAEYEVIDAATGEVLAVGMRQGVGKPLKGKTDKVQLNNFKPVLDTWARDAGAFFKMLR